MKKYSQQLYSNSFLFFFTADLGDYLISKGGDDSIQNVNGLTCYEGLEIDEI